MSEASSRNQSRISENAVDAALLERIAAEDRAALAELYERYYDRLLGFIYRLTGDLGTSQEGVNDVMLVVWRKASGFAGRSLVSTWIMGIAYRKAMRLGERLRRWTLRFKAADWSASIEPVTGTGGLTDEMMTEDLLERAIRYLPPKQRAVVELTYFQGCSYEEIAGIVECPENTVKTRMFHARAKLKEILPQLGYDAAGDKDAN
jgi:RNA polymerase sigma factor (sigma-70 family)